MEKTLVKFPFNEGRKLQCSIERKNKVFEKKTQVKSKRLKLHLYRKISVGKT